MSWGAKTGCGALRSQPYPQEYTAAPSGWLIKAACAVKLKIGPVMPGAAA